MDFIIRHDKENNPNMNSELKETLEFKNKFILILKYRINCLI